MSRRRTPPVRRKRGECFLLIQFWELESPAVEALSADATRVYLFMRKRLNFDCSNNGEVPFSLRDAQKALHSEWRRAANALAELIHFGFIKLRNGGIIGAAIRVACEWQLTAFPCGGQEAAKTFMRWSGKLFEAPYKSRKTLAAEKQPPTGNGTARRRQRDGAFASDESPVQPELGKSAGNGTALRASERRQRDGTSTVTSQGGPPNGAPAAAAKLPWRAPTYRDLGLTGAEWEAEQHGAVGSNGRSRAKRPKTAASPKTPRSPKSAPPTLRDRVFALLKSHRRPLRPAEIMKSLAIEHKGEAHRALRELLALGVVEKVDRAQYRVVDGARMPISGAREAGEAWPAPERKAAGLSQVQLAALAGVDRAYIAVLEQGRRQPSANRREAIERALRGSVH
jgi:hypothetical protein